MDLTVTCVKAHTDVPAYDLQIDWLEDEIDISYHHVFWRDFRENQRFSLLKYEWLARERQIVEIPLEFGLYCFYYVYGRYCYYQENSSDSRGQVI